MMPENSNDFNGEDQPLRPEATGNDDRLQDASNSDAAAENARETERIKEASRAAVPSYQLDEDPQEGQNKGAENHTKLNEDDEPATTQGTEEEIEENLSGTTNLSLDQLKKERDPGGYSLEGEENKD